MLLVEDDGRARRSRPRRPDAGTATACSRPRAATRRCEFCEHARAPDPPAADRRRHAADERPRARRRGSRPAPAHARALHVRLHRRRDRAPRRARAGRRIHSRSRSRRTACCGRCATCSTSRSKVEMTEVEETETPEATGGSTEARSKRRQNGGKKGFELASCGNGELGWLAPASTPFSQEARSNLTYSVLSRLLRTSVFRPSSVPSVSSTSVFYSLRSARTGSKRAARAPVRDRRRP